MKISKVTLPIIKYNDSLKNNQIFKTNPIPMDTFEKTNVSFGGKDELSDGFIDKIIEEIFKDIPDGFVGNFSDLMMGKLNDMIKMPESPFNAAEDDFLKQMVGDLSETFGDYTDLVEYEQLENQFETILELYSDKKVRERLKPVRNNKIDDYLYGTLDMLPDSQLEYIVTLFLSAGFKNVANLETFAQVYSRNPKPFSGQALESVEIYGILKNKDDLSKYGELLLYLYNEEYSKEKADYDVLNRTTAFLKQIGLNNFDDFESKFGHLKSKFNDFEDIIDKADAIAYTQKTYDAKIQLLDAILKQNPALKSQNSQKLYSVMNDVVDYFYEKNDQQSLDGLSNVIEYAAFQNKFKPIGLKQIASNFNEFKMPEDKIEFYSFLKDCGISISDFNALVGKMIISDIQPLDIYKNKEELVEKIVQIKGSSKDGNNFETYKKFKDVINAAYDENTQNADNVRILINLINRFKLKDSNSFLDFYNKSSNVKKQNISSDELKQFVELFKYNDSPSLLEEARRQNTIVVELLAQEKEKFLSLKDEIEKFMISDENSHFAGETSLSVYKKYRNSLIENPQNVDVVLQNIVNFDIKGQEEYQAKAEHIKRFSHFFEDKEALINFFAQNNITFDGSQEDNDRLNNAYTIFNALYDEDNKEQSAQRIKYFAQSGFLTKSENKLNEFLFKMPYDETKKSVLSLIADKEIPSLTHFEKFFKRYETKTSDGKELISFLKNLPDDFASGMVALARIQFAIENLNIPVRLNGDNVVSIDMNRFYNIQKYSTDDLIDLLNSIYNTPNDRNFLGVMSALKTHQDDEIDAFKVAKEIAMRIDKSSESYRNIAKLLHIDKRTLGLDWDCSTYIYARAIQDVLPKELIELVKSDDWTQYIENGNKPASLSLHARLRAIDRFALDGVTNAKEINTPEIKQRLKDLLATVYTSKPVDIRSSFVDDKIIADFIHDGKEVEVVFGQDGRMVTIVPRYKIA